jgi:HTH-type transcriptional regulator / antitoxin HigA
MAENKAYAFVPDYTVHPGEILEETLAARGMQKGELAERCGLSPKTVSLIICGKAPITPETAIQLERVLGVSAVLWSNLDTNHRLFKARLADQNELEKNNDWISQFPVKHLIKRGVLKPSEDDVYLKKQLLDFFGVGSIAAWEDTIKRMQVAYRRSPAFKSSPPSVATWLRIGELKAEGIQCKLYNKSKFTDSLAEIRGLTCENPDKFVPKVRELCCNAGVVLVFVAELPGTHLSGATRWIRSDKALIMLSLRHKSDDHLWFSFFHEAGHILLHDKKSVFLDGSEKEENEKELEADQFAAEMLIPTSDYHKFFDGKEPISPSDVESFAKAFGIAPGIVVGRLQHDQKIGWNTLNSLKRRLKLVERSN